jgi:hypothetical protein
LSLSIWIENDVPERFVLVQGLPKVLAFVWCNPLHSALHQGTIIGAQKFKSQGLMISGKTMSHWFMVFYKNFSIPSEKPPWPILFNSSNVGQENLDKTRVTQPPLVKLNPVQVNFTKKVYLAICSCSMVETNEILYILHCNACSFEVLIMI